MYISEYDLVHTVLKRAVCIFAEERNLVKMHKMQTRHAC